MALILQSVIVSLSFLFLFVLRFSASKKDYFDSVPKELRCSGCELTVKVLNQMLRNADQKNLEKYIGLVLMELCDEKKFKISEYKADYVVQTCKFMKDYHGAELMHELLKHYSQPKKSTYMDLSQQICLNIMRLCPGHAHRLPDNAGPKKHDDADGSILDNLPDDDELVSMEHFKHFLKVSGFDAKLAKPVRASHHDEL